MIARKKLSLSDKVQILARQAICVWCNKPLEDGEPIEWDHVVPLALGGSDSWGNIAACHRACHREKTKPDISKIASERRRQKKRFGQ